MSRSARLFDLLQILRRHRFPVSGAALARDLGVSVRTLYRDIATLQEQGAAIDGAPGLGYVLRPGFMLPPLMFTHDELEAIVLGAAWVAQRGDGRLGAAARDAAAKIAAVLPAELRALAENSALLAGPGAPLPADARLTDIREAIRAEHKLELSYSDLRGAPTQRTVWPFALGFFDEAHVLVAWCELRGAVRHFRVDRIAGMAALAQRYPRRRHVLLREWRASQGIGGPA